MSRNYPIRTTRNNWSIKFYSNHKCDENCNIIMEICDNDSDQIIIKNNPSYSNGKCEYYNQIIKTSIRISLFNKNIPYGILGKLINPYNIVIPDNSFTVSIMYPLSNIFNVKISSENSFSLVEIIYSIKLLYEYIYNEEERTSTPQIYNLKKICSSCGLNDLSEYVDEINDEEKTNECTICYDNYLDDVHVACKLKCKHIFHNLCINNWIKKSKTCPLCRYNIFMCEKCQGTGIIYYQFEGVVIPLENRNPLLNRNYTNGIFGIFGFDIDDLILNEMYYDRITKKLIINVTS